MKVLLVTPPFTQVNTFYPATGVLAGFLEEKGFSAVSRDLSLEVFLNIFCREGLQRIFSEVEKGSAEDPQVIRTIAMKQAYQSCIDGVIEFLQGKHPEQARFFSRDGALPKGAAFLNESQIGEAFGAMGIQDKAKYFCSLLINDLTAFIQKTVDPNFGLSRYAESLAVSVPEFCAIEEQLSGPPTLIGTMILDCFRKVVDEEGPDAVVFTVPFPGCLLSALMCAKELKIYRPGLPVIAGGGYVNTELRSLSDSRFFDYVDFLCFDDGENPLLNILKNIETPERQIWTRTMMRVDGRVIGKNNDPRSEAHEDLPAPSLKGIRAADYPAFTDLLNPMHRLWNDGFWNKLTLAHGCYWGKCSFCDCSLDYIQRYSPAKAKTLVDRMECLIRQTGRRGFHFTDEAAPPALLKELALEILTRGLSVSWWGNIRFERAFTEDLCRLLAASGCIAVSGGIETAEDSLLKTINKGVDTATAARVCNNFHKTGIMVHAYLMYGIPGQTAQQTVDSLEVVRQFFKNNLIDSAFYHRFALTVHSPFYENAEQAGFFPESVMNSFANNEVPFRDPNGADPAHFGEGLRRAVYNYMHRNALNVPVEQWFDVDLPASKISEKRINTYLKKRSGRLDGKSRSVWLGEAVYTKPLGSGRSMLVAHSKDLEGEWEGKRTMIEAIAVLINESRPSSLKKPTFAQWEERLSKAGVDIDQFMKSDLRRELHAVMLLFV